jgi:hypothetical protein
MKKVYIKDLIKQGSNNGETVILENEVSISATQGILDGRTMLIQDIHRTVFIDVEIARMHIKDGYIAENKAKKLLDEVMKKCENIARNEALISYQPSCKLSKRYILREDMHTPQNLIT